MRTDVISAPEDLDQEALSQLFMRHHLLMMPVVDAEGRIKGVVNVNDIVDVVQEEATEDIQKLGAVETLQGPYLQVPLPRMIRKRAGWLAALFLGEMLTATAMGQFEAEIARAVVLALFVPLIISSGGNSGAQATTLVIRAMALGEVRLRDWWRVIRREVITGFGLGTILASIGMVRILLWQFLFDAYGDHYFLVALTVAFSLVGVVLWGSGRRFDPAVYLAWFGFRPGERVGAVRRDSGRRNRFGDLFLDRGGGAERHFVVARIERADCIARIARQSQTSRFPQHSAPTFSLAMIAICFRSAIVHADAMSNIASKLAKVIDPARIVTDSSMLDELSWDALSEGRMHPNHHPELHTPLCAVKPQSTDEVRRIVQFANAEKIALVPFGGGSGLMGGAIPIRPSLAIDLRDLKQIVEIDTAARSARVQAGVVLEALDARLNEAGLHSRPRSMDGSRCHHRRRDLDQQRRLSRRYLRFDGRAGFGLGGGAAQWRNPAHATGIETFGGHRSQCAFDRRRRLLRCDHRSDHPHFSKAGKRGFSAGFSFLRLSRDSRRSSKCFMSESNRRCSISATMKKSTTPARCCIWSSRATKK